jgi:MarR-like DNA-binding transcriptional regulator SgrR of sgrS sRNA
MLKILLLFSLSFIGCNRDSSMLTVLLNPKKLDSHLDPLSIPYTNDFYLLENLTVKLLSLDEKGNYQLDLAKSIKPLNERSYLIAIKESYFSNGELITSEDVKRTILRSAGVATSHTILKDLIESVEVISKTELRVLLKKPVRSFFYYLSLPDFGILHRDQYSKSKLIAQDFVNITSGPFSYSFDGKDYFLIKNSGYRLSESSYFEKVKLLSYFEKNLDCGENSGIFLA